MKIIDNKNRLVGEGPLWDDQKQKLYTVDIQNNLIISVNLSSGEVSETRYPQQIGCIALDRDGNIIAAAEDGIYYAESDGSFTPLVKVPDLKGRRFNDGKVGPDGHFYVGTISNTTEYHDGAFYRLSPTGELTELFDNVGNSNGLAWSPDETKLFYTDTRRHRVDVFDFDKTSHTLSNRRTVVTVDEKYGSPDGMTIDENGLLWIGLWNGNGLLLVDTKTEAIVKHIPLPTDKVTCCAFCGDMTALAVTTAATAVDLSSYPNAGNTFLLSTDSKGLKTFRFKGNKENFK